MNSLSKSESSYLFVSYIPKDLKNHFGGKSKFRVSLKSGIYSESRKLSRSLQIVMDRIYGEMREGMKSSLSLDDVKDILRKEIKQSQTHSNYFSYLGVDRKNETSIEEGLKRLEEEENEKSKQEDSQTATTDD